MRESKKSRYSELCPASDASLKRWGFCALNHALTACIASEPSKRAHRALRSEHEDITSTLRVSTEDKSSGPREEKTPSLTSSSTSTLRVCAGSSSTQTRAEQLHAFVLCCCRSHDAPGTHSRASCLGMWSTGDSRTAEARRHSAQGCPIRASSSRRTSACRSAM